MFLFFWDSLLVYVITCHNSITMDKKKKSEFTIAVCCTFSDNKKCVCIAHANNYIYCDRTQKICHPYSLV